MITKGEIDIFKTFSTKMNIKYLQGYNEQVDKIKYYVNSVI